MSNEKLNFNKMFWLFIIGSVLGWFIEGVWTLIYAGKLINHSAVVIGPFNMAYGICACLLSVLLVKYKDDSFFKIFLIGFIGGSVIEYLMSFGMEMVLGFSAWNYSRYFLNINGRVCLLFSIFWGFIAIIWIKYFYPLISNLIEKIEPHFNKKIQIIIITFLVFDVLLTGCAVARAKEWEKGIPPENAFESFLDKTFNKKYLVNMFNNAWGD